MNNKTEHFYDALMDATAQIDAWRKQGKIVLVSDYQKDPRANFVVTVADAEVGDGATICYWSDCDSATIIARTAKTLTLQEDTQELLNNTGSGEPDALKFAPGGFLGHTSGTQRWKTEPNPKGRIHVARLTKRGWMAKGLRVSVGVRNPHYDFNF